MERCRRGKHGNNREREREREWGEGGEKRGGKKKAKREYM
jgi:hypothetical protein